MQLKEKSTTFTYQLKSIILHNGTWNEGHYIAVIKDDASQNWTRFDDDHVKIILESKAINGNAYIITNTKI